MGGVKSIETNPVRRKVGRADGPERCDAVTSLLDVRVGCVTNKTDRNVEWR